MLLASNKSLAEYNLGWEPRITVGKQKLVELYQKACQLEKCVEEKEKQMGNQGDYLNFETALALLHSATTQAEEESETLAEKFLDHTLDVDTFLEEFQLRRKTAHLRKVKSDKMKELIAKQKQLSFNSNSVRPAPPPPTYANQQAQPSLFSPLPYPVSGASLPYPVAPPNQITGMPYPVLPYPSSTPMYPPRF